MTSSDSLCSLKIWPAAFKFMMSFIVKGRSSFAYPVVCIKHSLGVIGMRSGSSSISYVTVESELTVSSQ